MWTEARKKVTKRRKGKQQTEIYFHMNIVIYVANCVFEIIQVEIQINCSCFGGLFESYVAGVSKKEVKTLCNFFKPEINMKVQNHT